MTHKHIHGVYVLAFVLAASLTTQVLSSARSTTLLGSLVQGKVTGVILPQVLDRSASIARNRAIQAVLDRCNERTSAGEHIDCPDVNDQQAVDAFMNEEYIMHAAAPVAERLDAATLSDDKRALLQKYVDGGTCSQSLRRVVPGLYELCISLTVDPTTRTFESPVPTMEERREQRKLERIMHHE